VGSLSPGVVGFTVVLLVLYGVLVGGTWVRRVPGKMWNTASTIIFIVIAAMVTLNLVFVQVRQADSFRKAIIHTDCVAAQIDAIRIDLQTPTTAPLTMPNCDVHWDGNLR